MEQDKNIGRISVTLEADTRGVHKELDILEARLIVIENRIERIQESARSITGERC